MKNIEEQIIFLRKQNIKIKDICNLLSIQKGTVGYYINKHGLKLIKKEKKEKRIPLSKQERKKQNVNNVVNWKRRTKIKLLEYKGNKCVKCGYNKCLSALEFHHQDPKQKDFSISSNSYSLNKMKIEVDKCDLLCSNCHREEHEKIRNNGSLVQW